MNRKAMNKVYVVTIVDLDLVSGHQKQPDIYLCKDINSVLGTISSNFIGRFLDKDIKDITISDSKGNDQVFIKDSTTYWDHPCEKALKSNQDWTDRFIVRYNNNKYNLLITISVKKMEVR